MTSPVSRTLAPDDRMRLVKILGMLGSEHNGERAAAALHASAILAEHGLTWDDVLAGPMTGERLAAEWARAMAEAQTQPKASWTTPTGSRGRAAPRATSRAAKPSFETAQAAREDADWRRHQLFCLKHLDQLSIVEQAFVRSIGLTGRPRTQRRRMVVELAARLRAAGAQDDPP
jgi:hypothetical protein